MSIEKAFDKWDIETMHDPIDKVFFKKGMIPRIHTIIQTERKRAFPAGAKYMLEEIESIWENRSINSTVFSEIISFVDSELKKLRSES